MPKYFPYETFEEYTVLFEECLDEEFLSECPDQKYTAWLGEISKYSLHSHGGTKEEAVRELKESFYWLKNDIESNQLIGLTPIAKFIYKLGGMDADANKFRILHPIAWILIFPSIIIIYLSKVLGYMVAEFVNIIKEARENLTWW